MIWSAIVPSFLASSVEFVEALTIVLVVGTTINWKSSIWGTVVAIGVLALLIGVLGLTLVEYVPIQALRLIVGIVLLLFGLKWLKKSLLRYAGLKALHDEEAIFEEERAALRARGEIARDRFDGFGFATSFKSVLLEGLEVAFIVITFGTSSGSGKAEQSMAFSAAIIGAAIALICVLALGFAVKGPLKRIPENTLKFAVGLMLASFGTFWACEGLGLEWPLGDVFIPILIAAWLLLSGLIVAWLRSAKKADRDAPNVAASPAVSVAKNPAMVVRFLKSVFNFFVGDWILLGGTALAFGLAAIMERAVPVLPGLALILVAGVAALSLVLTLARERQ